MVRPFTLLFPCPPHQSNTLVKNSFLRISLIISNSSLFFAYGLLSTGPEECDDMAQEKGLIVRIDDKGWAEVVTQRRDTCGGCHSGHCCTAFAGSSKMLIKAANRVGAGEGDLVSIDLVSGGVIRISAILYIIPVLGLIFGAVLGSALDPGWFEATPLFTFVGLAMGFLVTVLISRHLSKKEEFTPVITGIIKSGARNNDSLVARDPVCKALVDPAQAPASLTYQEKAYHFCDPGCRDIFLKHPQEYV